MGQVLLLARDAVRSGHVQVDDAVAPRQSIPEPPTTDGVDRATVRHTSDPATRRAPGTQGLFNSPDHWRIPIRVLDGNAETLAVRSESPLRID